MRYNRLRPNAGVGASAPTQRELGVNPRLPRSGKRERAPRQALAFTGWEAVRQGTTVGRFASGVGGLCPPKPIAGGSEPSQGSELDRRAREPEDLPASGAGRNPSPVLSKTCRWACEA